MIGAKRGARENGSRVRVVGVTGYESTMKTNSTISSNFLGTLNAVYRNTNLSPVNKDEINSKRFKDAGKNKKKAGKLLNIQNGS